MVRTLQTATTKAVMFPCPGQGHKMAANIPLSCKHSSLFLSPNLYNVWQRSFSTTPLHRQTTWHTPTQITGYPPTLPRLLLTSKQSKKTSGLWEIVSLAKTINPSFATVNVTDRKCLFCASFLFSFYFSCSLFLPRRHTHTIHWTVKLTFVTSW